MVARRSARGGQEQEGQEIQEQEVENQKEQDIKEENPRDVSPPDSPFFGFSNADIPQPIMIKAEPLDEGAEDDEVQIVMVTRAAQPLPPAFIKMEREDDDDVDIFYGFGDEDLPRPIVIKEEVEDEEEEVVAERGPEAVVTPYWLQVCQTS